MDDSVNPKDLEGLPASEQKMLMKEWFAENFEDPAERTPYESAEGGYIWIWGGPFDAEEELGNAFSQYVDQQVISELVDELESHCVRWAPTPQPGDYDDYLVDDISSITEAHQNFVGAIADIKLLLDVDTPSGLENQYCRLLFVNVITAIETFLSDAFISKVMGTRKYFEAFVKTNPDFKQQKFALSEILDAMDQLESTVKTHLLEVVWHNLKRVSEMYKATLSVDFPSELGDIYRAILKRHDIVHRNGKDKDGNAIFVNREDVLKLIGDVENLATHVDWHIEDFDF